MKYARFASVAAFLLLVGAGCMPAAPSEVVNAPVNASPPASVGNAAALADKIVVTSPQPNDKISSPVVVSGKALGTWYFEASFPAEVVDANGVVLGQVPAQAQGDWMTADFVPFSVSIPFTTPTTATGTIILKRDNPSGLPENDAQLEIPVTF